MSPEYVVMIVNLIIWAGIFFYLLKTDRAVKELKREIDRLSDDNV